MNSKMCGALSALVLCCFIMFSVLSLVPAHSQNGNAQVMQGGSATFGASSSQGASASSDILNPAGVVVASFGHPAGGSDNGWELSVNYNGSDNLPGFTVSAPANAPVAAGYRVRTVWYYWSAGSAVFDVVPGNVTSPTPTSTYPTPTPYPTPTYPTPTPTYPTPIPTYPTPTPTYPTPTPTYWPTPTPTYPTPTYPTPTPTYPTPTPTYPTPTPTYPTPTPTYPTPTSPTPTPTVAPTATPTSPTATPTSPTATPTSPTPTPLPEESWGKLHIFKDNNGQPGQEMGRSQTQASQAGVAARSIADNTVSVGGDVWITFQLRRATNEVVINDIESAVWFIEDPATGTKQRISFPLEDKWYSSSRFDENNNPVTGYNTTDAYSVTTYAVVFDTRFLANRPYQIKLYRPLRDEETGDPIYENGDFKYVPVESLSYDVYAGPVSYWYNRGTPVRSYEKPIEPVTLNVKNMTIVEAKAADGNEDYLRLDTESENPDLVAPSVNFEVQDINRKPDDRYEYEVVLRETNKDSSHVADVVLNGPLTMSESGHGSSVVALPENLVRGVYGFDVRVRKFGKSLSSNEEGNEYDAKLKEGLSDRQDWRSPASFSATSLAIEGETEEDAALKFHYRIPPFYFGSWFGLNGYPRAETLSAVKIEALDGALNRGTQTVDGPREFSVSGAPDHIVDAPQTDSEEAGEGRVIVTGADDYADIYRDHKPKRLWPVSAQQPFVQKTQISMTCIDSQEGAPDAVSGLDINTVTASTVTFSVARNGGGAQNSTFTPSVAHPNGVSGDAITMLLDYRFSVGKNYRYSVTMSVTPDGVMDKAGNEFDIDGDRTNGGST